MSLLFCLRIQKAEFKTLSFHNTLKNVVKLLFLWLVIDLLLIEFEFVAKCLFVLVKDK